MRIRTAAIVAALCVVTAGCAGRASFPEGQVVDLSYAFDADTVYWPTANTFVLERGPAGVTPKGYFYAANDFRGAEHGGTHIDAPFHFFEGGVTVDRIPLERLMGPGAVVDVSQRCEENRDYLVSVSDLEGWEASHGRLPDGAIVLLRTGFGRFWPDRERYMGTAERGAGAVASLHFPGLDPEAATWLATQRSIGAVGIDTPSIDHGPSVTFDSHVRLFEHGVPALENVARLDRLPDSGFVVVALPMKIRDGSGGPTRIVAIMP